MFAFGRILTVTLTSRKLKKSIVFGEEYLQGRDDLNLNVVVYKYMSTLKDSATIRISNIPYDKIVSIIDGEFYDVEIKCGYRTTSAQTIFKGGVLYVTNQITNIKDHTLIILCASQLLARYGQSRINLTLNSGINMYSAINYISKKAGIRDANISTQLKLQKLQASMNVDSTAGAWIDKLTQQNQSYIANSDSISDAVFSIFDSKKSNQRYIPIGTNMILTDGWPRLSKDGLNLTMLPLFGFMGGDTIHLDNSIIDISSNSQNEANMNKGYYLDQNGNYMIFEATYNLTNRSDEFSCELLCKSRGLISNYIGAL